MSLAGSEINKEAPSPRVLIVDPDQEQCRSLAETVAEMGCEVVTARSAESAFHTLRRRRHELVIAALDTPGLGGIGGISKILEVDMRTVCVAVSAGGGAEEAAAAVQRGAFDCLARPVIVNALRRATAKALAHGEVLREKSLLQRVVEQQPLPSPIVAESAPMREAVELAGRLAGSTSPVLITGETGAGKGLLARYLHDKSPRAGQPFVQVNCGAVQEQLVESELFGHEAGAFTGAVSRRLGLFEAADRGSLFLDEVGELAMTSQAKLLQVLDTGEIRRVGGNELYRVNSRVIAATNRDLEQEVARGRFRQDLLFRLKVLEIRVPPLRRRGEDFDGLVDLYLERFGRSAGARHRMTPAVRRQLREYSWPGNVRELASVIERVCLLAAGEEIEEQEVEPMLRAPGRQREQGAAPVALRDVERLHIQRILERTGGVRAAAAELLEIDVKTLRRKIRAYGLE